jgi:molybdopterin molybdotransferase
MLTPAEADALIAARLAPRPIESLPVGQCGGAFLRENVYAERDQPPYDRATMDGIAVSAAVVRAGARRLPIEATQAAGDPPRALVHPGGCLEIMTGAVLPQGCDAVIPVERIRVEGGQALLPDDLEVVAGQNLNRRGSDQSQGTLLLSAGIRLAAPEIAVAAGAGMARLRVGHEPQIMVVSTGNELVEPGEPIQPWQIRRSNAYAVCSALRQRGFARVADDHIVDDAGTLAARFRQHLDTHDVLVLSGGVSMGKFDLVPEALAACGVQQVFHRIAQRPGKPMWFGVAGNGTAVFALPGNPVSTLVCLTRYVIPALEQAMAAGQSVPRTERIALAAPLTFNLPLSGFVPVRVETDEWARPWAVTVPNNGSGDYAALAGTDGFVELPPGPHVYPKGFVARLYRW